jgi:hypothetical protein
MYFQGRNRKRRSVAGEDVDHGGMGGDDFGEGETEDWECRCESIRVCLREKRNKAISAPGKQDEFDCQGYYQCRPCGGIKGLQYTSIEESTDVPWDNEFTGGE